MPRRTADEVRGNEEGDANSAKRARTEDNRPTAADEEQPNNGSAAAGRPFSEFNLSSGIVQALEKQGIVSLFPVQALTFEAIMRGEDVLVQARTGSGKTLAFGIPIIEKLNSLKEGPTRGRGPAAVIFCPTRELAIQVRDVIAGISGGLSVTALYGGVAYNVQERALYSGVDVVVATPGRAKDFLEKGTLRFDRVKMVCLDEADHMLDIGFKEDIELLLQRVAEQNGSVPNEPKHQTLLFSATVPDWVHTCSFISKNKKFIDMVGQGAMRAANTIKFYRRKCSFGEVSGMLADLVKAYSGRHGRTLVFTNTKKNLPMVDLVIQCAPPTDIDAFIHRAGRTGRAGRKGVCVMLHQPKDEYIVERIERHAKIKFEVLPAPTREEILKAVARDAAEDLARVERSATNLFLEQAAELLKDADPTEILASAIAVMSGYTSNITKRGLITGAQGSSTIQMVGQRPLPIHAFCSILRNNLGDHLFTRCRDITLLQDMPGCVFDVPEELVPQILAAPIHGMELSVIETLPPIIARELHSGGRGGGGGGGGHQHRYRGGGGGGGYRGNNYHTNRRRY
uniref:RNA helicase n=1 Tax=Trypanosoma vivax (strain Y486) TaxID=1055687 RepID=G0TW65_TRYVY|nr:putative nucleolar RNA helicase II, fragment [Trypanosoma vivax Y486]